ncbi:GNAT family N-acetyltransferase [Pseudomonas sp. 57B-090624]|uniref:GNAT family N-acetyltransferase n=1 Tax=Pseudomonas sp. 57B-090624 TaxID=2213080 RepID=UPI000DA7ED24|nr:GNAT family N-acetyltransferase [Pseudomonas sp. 57B-090624]PZE13349.1 GNAT family N-acetyltransferase [Pseudomonas sp. 57B-090624]
MQTYFIDALLPAEFDEFVNYLDEHLQENGSPEVGYFQPLSRDAGSFPEERKAAFRAGLEIAVGEPGWRRAWVARGVEGQILGHIDLRAHAERYTAHRCLLGMGVHRSLRRQGLGAALIEHARLWAESSGLEWIDLQVLSNNQAARALYEQAGFLQIGEVPNMFKIDGRVFSYTTMTRRCLNQ